MTSIADARYFGSVEEAHGHVIDIDDCVCTDCVLLDPWDPARRFALRVIPDARHGETVRLAHVRSESFTGWR